MAAMNDQKMWMVTLDVEGTLTPEAWLALQEKTKLEELKKTTAHEPDYDKLMQFRIDVLRQNGITIDDMKEVVGTLQPLEGAVEFLQWLKPRVPRAVLLTDTFQEYAMPMFEMLGYPSVFCHSVEVDEEHFITRHVLRLRDQKRKCVEAFQHLGHRIIAVGDSFNDISMLTAAEYGILFRPAEKVLKAHPEFPVVYEYAALQAIMSEMLGATTPRFKELPPPSMERAPRSMWMVAMEMEGTLAPEAWLEGQAEAIRKGLTMKEMQETMGALEPLEGAVETIGWLKPRVPRALLLTDACQEYAMPMAEQLGYPCMFSNAVTVDEAGRVQEPSPRVEDPQRAAVQAFQHLGHRVIAVGGGRCGAMLGAADVAILFRPSAAVEAAHPNCFAVSTHAELRERLQEIIATPASSLAAVEASLRITAPALEADLKGAALQSPALSATTAGRSRDSSPLTLCA